MSSSQSWHRKFAVAISGIFWAARSQTSFRIHLPIAAAVIVLAAWGRVDAWRWVAVLLAIAMVLSAELLNTSIEQLVSAVHPAHDERIGRALDAAAGAVLVLSIAAILIGLIALGPPLLVAVGWLD